MSEYGIKQAMKDNSKYQGRAPGLPRMSRKDWKTLLRADGVLSIHYPDQIALAERNPVSKTTTGRRWVQSGCPVVHIEEPYAYALMSSDPPPVKNVRWPWNTFWVDVPDGFQFKTPGRRTGPVTTVNALLIQGGSTLLTTEILLLGSGCKGGLTGNLNAAPLDSDEPAIRVIKSYVINLAAALSDPENVKTVQRKKYRPHSKRNRDPETVPDFQRFTLRNQTVHINCKPALEDYLEGKRRGPMKVQALVRGHWRNQACGPLLQNRKLIWIQPHWKGPEDGLVSIRNHQLSV